MGSSAVQILRFSSFSSRISECKVVVLPQPVGPQTRSKPWGLAISKRSADTLAAESPMRSSGKGLTLPSKRSTTSSKPPLVGTVTMRTSMRWVPKREKSSLPS